MAASAARKLGVLAITFPLISIPSVTRNPRQQRVSRFVRIG
jgi:hypothetical protein